MHVILWRYRVHPGREAEFEAAYGQDGVWERLFRSTGGFLGTELMRGTDGTYLTIDRWVSPDAHRALRDAQSAQYAELDGRCAGLTIEEALVAEVEA
jgi:heme-degrading monooxygenase HmoA